MCHKATSTRLSPRHWRFPGPFKTDCAVSRPITAEDLHIVREPLRLELSGLTRHDPRLLGHILARAARGPALDGWKPPQWLLEHQFDAARRAAGSLLVFGGALLADAVGLGKTYVSLAITTRYHRCVTIVPASLVSQWQRVAIQVQTPITVISHEALSRGQMVPTADLVIVDEAHRFRNPNTRRYDRLARDLGRAHLLLVSATPVVNGPRDLASLLRLFLPDNGLAALGLSSIERAVANQDHTTLAHAAASLVVARTLRVLAGKSLRMPEPKDGQVRRPPPLALHELDMAVDATTRLTFPGSIDGRAVELLRGHLLHRLASSTAAFRETLRRHLAYLDRAIVAFEEGGTVSRSVARHLLGPGDDLQLELGPFTPVSPSPIPEREAFEEERRHVLELIDRLPSGEHLSPKAHDLGRILADRGERRTIVFVSAVSTALDLARRLGWRQVAVIGGGSAWISSGRVPVDFALGLFAPRARRAAEPSRITRITTLIATDLVSEGLDLQDADAIVHYDLPWTPLRLAQRLGRIVRLGSEHSASHVYWFEPPPVLEQRLRTAQRLGDKANQQLELGVPVTSRVGRAQVMNTMFEYRECLGDQGPYEATDEDGIPMSVMPGPSCLLVALRWLLPTGTCRELLTASGTPLKQVCDYRATHVLRWTLCRKPTNAAGLPNDHLQEILGLLKLRLRTACSSPSDSDTTRLKRIVLDHARSAGHERNGARIGLLDEILNRLSAGLATGPERELTQLLTTELQNTALRTWLTRNPPRPVATPICRIEAILCGDGLEP